MNRPSFSHTFLCSYEVSWGRWYLKHLEEVLGDVVSNQGILLLAVETLQRAVALSQEEAVALQHALGRDAVARGWTPLAARLWRRIALRAAHD